MLDNLISAVLHFSSGEQTQQKSFHYSHPLHVAVSDHEFLKCAEDYKLPFVNQFCGVIFVDDAVLPYRNLFVIVHVRNFDTKDQGLNSEILHLYVTTKFLEHYKFSHGTLVFFKPIDCFPVSKVVLHAQTVESYVWTKSKDWQMQLLLSTCRNKLLCRHNDVLLISPQIFGLKNSKLLFDIMVVVCEPVEQGIITMATTIVVVNVSDSLASHRSQVEFFQNKHYYSSLFPQQLEKNAQLRFQPTEGKYLKLQVMQLHALLINKILTDMNDLIDPLNVVIAPDEILKKMNISSGELTTITASSIFSVGLESEHALQKKSRLATFVSHPVNNEKACIAYISSHLWFNLTSQPTSLIESENLYIEVSSDEKTNLFPPYATEIYVSLVQSPHYDGTIVCDGILKSYFSRRRYILKGDIFGIDTKDAVDFRQKSNDLDNIRCPMVYFRISVIEGPFSNCGYFADVDHSKLYQAGTIQNYIPLFIENLPSPFSGSTYFDSPNPSGMNVYANQLVSLILPVLKIWNKGSFQNFRISMNILLTGSHGSGKTVIVKSVCRCLSLHLYEVNCHEIIGESSATTEARLKSVIQKASVYAPCIMLLKNIEFIGKEKELKGENSRVLNSLSEELKNVNFWRSEWPVIVIATTNDISLLSGDLISSFLHHIHINAPLEYERKAMLHHFMRPHALHPNVSTGYLSQRTAGFILGDLASLAVESVRFRYSRLKQILPLQRDSFLEEALTLSGIHVVQQDLISALEKEQSSKAEKSGAPKIPSVYWEDIGGLANAKEEILDTIQLPLKHPELLLTGLRRSGILLYGPPGTGKTLLAKAVATECSLNFLSVKGPELINMYVGQSEENVRAIFNQARSAIPCIIFFDELDSLAPSRGKSGDSGGVTDRVVSQFLAELDGINNFAQREVFVIGATNRPDLIDSALLRPGRFDRHVYVGISSDKESMLSIMTALTRKLPISSDVDLEEIVNKCPQNLTGADFYSLCSNAMMYSIKRNVKLIQEGMGEIRNAERTVITEDFFAALETLVPSLSENELQQYHSIKL